MGARQGTPATSTAAVASLALAIPSFETPPSHWGPPSDGRWRWAVNASVWEPLGGSNSAEFQFLLDLLPNEERSKVLEFSNFMDRKRSLLGRLLIRRTCARALGFKDFTGFEIGRTHGQKPFLLEPLPHTLPNFNFNLSHDGHWVVLASDPLRLVGIDVTAPQWVRGDREDDTFLLDLVLLLHDDEQARIQREPTVRGRYSIFQRLWSAKEALTKAVGEGLDFGLERIEVTLDGEGEADPFAQLKEWWRGRQPPEARQSSFQRADAPRLPHAALAIDMWPRPEWSIQQQALPTDHWLTVALGPVEEVKDRNGQFSTRLRLRGIDAEARNREIELPAPEFEILPVSSLVPEPARTSFELCLRKF